MPIAEFQSDLGDAVKAFGLYKDLKAMEAKGDTSSKEYQEKSLAYNVAAEDWSAAAKAAGALRELKAGDPAQLAFVDLMAAADKGDLKAVEPAYEAVRKADPDNAKGFLEKAVMTKCAIDFGTLRQTADSEATMKAGLKKITAQLKTLDAEGVKLTKPKAVYMVLAMLQLGADEKDGALATFKKLRPLVGKEEQAKIDEEIQKLTAPAGGAPAKAEK